MIHNNIDLSNVQKLHYLKEALIDNTKDLIRNFELIDESYSQTCSFLQSKFDYPLSIIRTLFRKLHDIETINKSRKWYSHFNRLGGLHCQWLKSNGEKFDDRFYYYLTYHVICCLDPETAKDWDNSLTSHKSFPIYSQLQKFMQKRLFTVKEHAAGFKPLKRGRESEGHVEKFEQKAAEKKIIISCCCCSK